MELLKAVSIVYFIILYTIQELKENTYLQRTRKLLEIQQMQNLKLVFSEAIAIQKTEFHATQIKDKIVINMDICVHKT